MKVSWDYEISNIWMEKSKPCSKPPTSSYMTCMGLNGYESFGDPYGMER